MPDGARARTPWTLVAASGLLVVLVLYLLFVAYLPTRKRIVRLEAELHDLYAREAQLHARLARDTERASVRDQQLAAFSRERETLTRRVEELERELAASRRPRRR